MYLQNSNLPGLIPPAGIFEPKYLQITRTRHKKTANTERGKDVNLAWVFPNNKFFFFFLVFFVFLGLHPWHMEVSKLGVESELWLPAYTTVTTMPDPSCVCDLHHSSQPRQILNPLSKARNRTCNLMVPSQIRFHCATTGTPLTAI